MEPSVEDLEALDRLCEAFGKWSQECVPASHNRPAYLFAHCHEEVSEAFKEWRSKRRGADYEATKVCGVNLTKPIGMPSEVADMIISALIVAHHVGVKPSEAVGIKSRYLFARLDARTARKNRKKVSRG